MTSIENTWLSTLKFTVVNMFLLYSYMIKIQNY